MDEVRNKYGLMHDPIKPPPEVPPEDRADPEDYKKLLKNVAKNLTSPTCNHIREA